MKSIKVRYRIPLGIHDILKRKQLKSSRSIHVIPSDIGKQEGREPSHIIFLKKLNEVSPTFHQQMTKTIVECLKLIINNTSVDLKEDELVKFISLLNDLDTFNINHLEVGDNFIRCKIDEESGQIKIDFNERDIFIDVHRENPLAASIVAATLEKLDRIFLDMEHNRIVYKYITENGATKVFSNKSGQWKHAMNVFLGFDIGSVSTNVAVIDEHQHVMETVYTYTRGRVLDAIKTSLREIQTQLPSNINILGVGVTGSSGELAKKILGADVYKTEIYSHAAATIHQIPEVRTILEIGGQDSKVIYVNNKIPEKSKMNEWCGAGTGAMLDAQAYRLGIPIQEFGDYALKATKSIDFRTRCGVFMDSCMIDAQAKGYPIEVIVSGLCKACAHNFVGTLGINRKTLEYPIAFQGGVAANKGVKKELEDYISKGKGEKCELIVPICHDVMGAIGMSLIVQKLFAKRQQSTNFRGFEDVLNITSEIAECNFENCPKNKKEDETICDIVLLKINKETIASIGACPEYEEELLNEYSSSESGDDFVASESAA